MRDIDADALLDKLRRNGFAETFPVLEKAIEEQETVHSVSNTSAENEIFKNYKTILSAVLKQSPMPSIREYTRSGSWTTYKDVCPVCRHELVNSNERYCVMCGQRIAWEDN